MPKRKEIMEENEKIKEDEKAEAYMPKKEKPKLKMSRYTVMLMPDSTDELKTYEITIDKIAMYVVLFIAAIIIIASLIVSFAVKNYRLRNDSSLQTVIDNQEASNQALQSKIDELTELLQNSDDTISEMKTTISELELETAGLYIPTITPYKGSAIMISDIIVKDSVSYNCLEGATVVVTANGTVEDISEDMYKQAVKRNAKGINNGDHKNGYKTKYTSTGKIKAKLNDDVVRGEAIFEILEDDSTFSYVVELDGKNQKAKDFIAK